MSEEAKEPRESKDSASPEKPTSGKPVRISLPPRPKESVPDSSPPQPLWLPDPPGKSVAVAFQPSWTIIIPTRPGDAQALAVAAAKRLDFPKDDLEIIVARGRQPSVQRNVALREAKGEFIYFLDDDSLPDAANLQRAAQHFKSPSVVMVGGPNVCPPDAPALEQAFAATMGNKLAFGPSAARYAPLGMVRESSEKELILCNLAARKGALLELGGFDEALYPNEENALMDDLQKRGGKLMYDPQFVVQRRPRSTVKAFVKMMMTYGRGRAEQFRLHPTLGSVLNFVPPLFVVYLLSLPVVLSIAFVPKLQYVPNLAQLVLLLYGIAVLGQAALQNGVPLIIRPLVAVFTAITHIFYGLGFWRGLFTPLKKGAPGRNAQVTLERISPE